MYKLSKFNVFFSYNDKKYVWNTRSGALIRLNKDGEEYISNTTVFDLEDEMAKILLKNGMIVKKQYDEVGDILIKEECAIYDRFPETVYYTIAPGMDCNYFCVYCFEKGRDRKVSMSRATAEDVITFIKKNCDSNINLKKINVKWFGGEPLLFLDIIEYITNELIIYCDNKKIKYEAGIITNGLFLSKEVALKLSQLKILSAQITIDGLTVDYCKNKGTTVGNFERVIANIKDSCENIKVSVRLNIPSNSAEKAIQVTDFLLDDNKLKDKIYIYFAFLRDYTKQDMSLDYKQYVCSYIKWYIHMNKQYLGGRDKRNASFVKTTTCASIRMCNYCIGPKGELYKCEHCIGEYETAIGNVIDGDYQNVYTRKYMETLNCGKRPQCLSCEYLPLCLGGCANDNVCGRPGFDCNAYKEYELNKRIISANI